MTPPSPSRPEDLLDAALAQDPLTRDAWLTDACAGDAALLAEVRALLLVHASMPSRFLTSPSGIDLDVTAAQTPGTSPHLRHDFAAHESPGDHIGPYKLLQQIGEGGFGTVWMADQEHP